MDDPPLSKEPMPPPDDLKDPSLPSHVRDKRQPGDPNPKNEPLDLSTGMETDGTVDPTAKNLPPKELVGRTFLLPPDARNARERAVITELIKDHKSGRDNDPEFLRFKCKVNDKHDEIVAYNDIVDYIESEGDDNYHFVEILDHKKVKRGDPEYRGCSISLLI